MNEIRKKLEKKKRGKEDWGRRKKKQTKTFFRIEAQIPAVYACVCVCVVAINVNRVQPLYSYTKAGLR